MDLRTTLTFAGYYGTFFASLGVWIPYWPLYLEHLGQGPQAIGALTALALMMKVAGPPVWGSLADAGKRRLVLILTSFAAVFSFSLFFLAGTFYSLLLVTLLYSFFHAGPLPLVEASAMEVTRHAKGDYGRLRLWGSWGFILLSMGLGPMLDHYGLILVPAVLLLLHFSNATLSCLLPAVPAHHQPEGEDSTTLFSQKRVWWFYLSALLMQFSHGAYYGFFSIHLEHHGFSRGEIGLLWALGVVAEVVVMAHSKWLLERLGVSAMLSLSLFLAAMRWGIYAFTLWMPLLLFGQLLHAFTFGAFHVAAIQRTFEMAPTRLRATAQGWYSSFSFGIGGSLGLLLGGFLFARIGAHGLFAWMALAACGGFLVSLHANRLAQE